MCKVAALNPRISKMSCENGLLPLPLHYCLAADSPITYYHSVWPCCNDYQGIRDHHGQQFACPLSRICKLTSRDQAAATSTSSSHLGVSLIQFVLTIFIGAVGRIWISFQAVSAMKLIVHWPQRSKQHFHEANCALATEIKATFSWYLLKTEIMNFV